MYIYIYIPTYLTINIKKITMFIGTFLYIDKCIMSLVATKAINLSPYDTQ